jgi:protein SCO1/2
MPPAPKLLALAAALLAGCAALRDGGTVASAPGRNHVPDPPDPARVVSICDLDAVWERDAGGKVTLAELNGRVRVVAMFYAACQGACVITRQDMQQIEASLSPAVRERVEFVLVTLDPARDTIPVLRSYRRAECLSSARWTLLRGDVTATSRLAALLGVAAGPDSSGRFVHSSELVVVDESGRILHRHEGWRADLPRIAREIREAATPRQNL